MTLLSTCLLTLAATQPPPLEGIPQDAERRAAAAAELERAGARSSAEPTLSFSVSDVVAQAVGVGALSDGSVVATGPNWLAHWEAGRFEFTTDAAAPEHPAPSLGLRLEQLGRANAPAVPGVASAVQVQEGGDAAQVRVQRAVAPGVLERWDARQAGVELSFLLDERPAGTGDLIVSLRVDTELSAPLGRRAAAESLDFTDGDSGGIRIGGVSALDAEGRATDGWLEWDGEHLSFRVPGDFVDTCSYPLLVDPVLSGLLTIFGTTSKDLNPDIAWDEASATWAVAWAHRIEGSDFPWLIEVQRLYSWGGLKGPSQVLESGAAPGWSTFHGNSSFLRIVTVTGPDVFVVAAATETKSGNSGSVLHWFPVDPQGGFLGADKTDWLAVNGTVNGIDLGTDPLSAYPNFLTVWTEWNFGSYSALSSVDTTGQVRGWGTGGSTVVKLTSDYFAGSGDGKVDVSSSAGPPGYWLVAWTSTTGPADAYLGGRVVSYYGAPVTPEVVIDSTTFPRVFNALSVAGDGSEYFIGYTYATGGQTLLYQRCELTYSGGWSLAVDPLPVYLDSFPYPESGSGVVGRCRIERVGEEYVAAWLRRTGTGDWTVRTASIATSHTPVFGTPLVISDLYSEGRLLRMGSQSAAKAYPSSGDKGLIVTDGSWGLVRMFVQQ